MVNQVFDLGGRRCPGSPGCDGRMHEPRTALPRGFVCPTHSVTVRRSSLGSELSLTVAKCAGRHTSPHSIIHFDAPSSSSSEAGFVTLLRRVPIQCVEFVPYRSRRTSASTRPTEPRIRCSAVCHIHWVRVSRERRDSLHRLHRASPSMSDQCDYHCRGPHRPTPRVHRKPCIRIGAIRIGASIYGAVWVSSTRSGQ